MKRCRTCLVPDTRPRTVLDATGQCNACKYHFVEKPRIDWQERKTMFQELVDENKQHPQFDCLVPFSGGKDSATIAHRLKYELGFRPLLVSFGQMLWTAAGRHNYERVRRAGFDCLYWAMNQEVSRKLARRFFIERGHPKAHYDAAINAVPVRIAKELGIPLIVYAEHGDTEYGGLILNEKSRRFRDLEEVLEHCVGDDARNWAGDGITEQDLAWTYVYPDDVKGITATYWSYHFRWDIYANAMYARDRMGFQPAHVRDTPAGAPWKWGRNDGSFEGFDSIDDMIDDLDFHMLMPKFGYGRATRMASRLIQYGHMTRENGLRLAQAYDGEYPRRYFREIIHYLGVSEAEFDKVIATHDEGIELEPGVRRQTKDDILTQRDRRIWGGRIAAPIG